jgi:HSP20 family molecular chaperone IbpA
MNLSEILNSISCAVERMSIPVGPQPTAGQKTELQKLLVEEFELRLNTLEASEEYRLGAEICGNRDRCDVYVKTSEYQIILEIDATRADQVAKKMLSRYFYANKIAESKPTVYICLLYPGTDSMNPNECVKYMRMGKDVLLSMNSSNRFIGAFINGNNVELKLIG